MHALRLTGLIAAAALALAGEAQGQKCVNIPLCFPPYDPPTDGLIVYEDAKPIHEWGVTCLAKVPECLGAPFWAAAGGLRTSAWYCSKNNAAVLSFTVTRAGAESPPSPVMANQPDAAWPNKCWEKLTMPAPPLHVSDLKSPSEKLADVGKLCLTDPICAQLVLDKCYGDANCKSTLATKLNSDFNLDGVIDSTDAAWFAAALAGAIR